AELRARGEHVSLEVEPPASMWRPHDAFRRLEQLAPLAIEEERLELGAKIGGRRGEKLGLECVAGAELSPAEAAQHEIRRGVFRIVTPQVPRGTDHTIRRVFAARRDR